MAVGGQLDTGVLVEICNCSASRTLVDAFDGSDADVRLLGVAHKHKCSTRPRHTSLAGMVCMGAHCSCINNFTVPSMIMCGLLQLQASS